MGACDRCGTENPEAARYCMSCGAALGPRETRDARRVVTAVFTDVAGSTELGERFDPESLRRIVTPYFDTMRQVVERHGGTVEKYIGDAILALFGLPAAHEDDALRAVRAAADMRSALAELNEDLERDWEMRLRVRTGVNTGEVIAGNLGAEAGAVLSDAVNVAARLEQAASPDEILIGETTYRMVRDAVVVQAIEPLTLKGKTTPVPAYRLVDVVPGAAPLARRMDAPLVGRERESTLLHQAFERATRDHTCHLVTVLGVAGVGKSRLAQELARSPGDRATVLSGRCLPYGEGITFWPLVEILRQAAGVTDADTAEEAARKIAATVPEEADAALIAERAAQLIGVVGGAGDAEETPWAVRRLLEAIARRRPLILVLDDIHWAEPALLDLIEHVADWSRNAPILLLCLARPELLEARPTWGGGKLNATSVFLEPLSEEEIGTLVSNLLGTEDVAGDLRTRVSQAAEGNPLFVEELLSMLIDDGVLLHRDGRWEATADLAALAMPPTIHALLTARLDRLAPEERYVLERASVEGKVFHRRAVEELGDPEVRPDLSDRLRSLVRKDLIRPGTAQFPGDEGFVFRHVLIRDAAYQGLPKEHRAELHARFADWLRTISGARLAEHEEIVGYHLERARRCHLELGGAPDRVEELGHRAAVHMTAAGRRALHRGDVHAAVNLLERSARLLPDRDPAWLPLQLDLGRAMVETGRFSEADEVLAAAQAAARDAGDTIVQWLAAMERCEIRVNTEPGAVGEDVLREAERAVRVFEELGHEAGLAKAWHVVALVRWNEAGVRETEAALEQAIRHAAAAGDRREAAENLSLLTMAASWGPTPVSEGLRRLDRILERAGSHRKVEAFVLLTRGWLEAIAGHLDEGRSLVAAGRSVLRDLGLRVAAAATSQPAGKIELLAGDLTAAEREFRAGYEALEAMGETAYLSTTAGLLAEALYRQGRDDEAERLTRVTEERADPADLYSQILWRTVRGKVLARRSRLEEALALTGDAVALAEGTDFVEDHAETLLARAEVLRLAGRDREAKEAIGRGVRLLEEKGNVMGADRARALLATPAPTP